MHARIVTSHLLPGRTEEAVDLWRDKVAPAYMGTKGFRGAFLLGDRASGKAVSITLWDSQAVMASTEKSGQFQHAVGLFAQMFVAPPESSRLEVMLQVAGTGPDES